MTGTFDGWTKSVKLNKEGDVFTKTVDLKDASQKIYYKVRGRSTAFDFGCYHRTPFATQYQVVFYYIDPVTAQPVQHSRGVYSFIHSTPRAPYGCSIRAYCKCNNPGAMSQGRRGLVVVTHMDVQSRS